MNGKEFVLKVRKGLVDWRSLFIYDKRTKSVRLHSNRELALSNQDSDEKGEKRLKDGKNVAMRQWKAQLDQITFMEDDKVKNKAKKCLTLRNYLDKEENLLTWWKCNKNDAQRWKHPFFKNKNGKTVVGKKNAGPVPKTAPINLAKLHGKEFHIRGQDGPRYGVRMDTRVKSPKSEINITSAPYDIFDKHQKFTWDQRTSTFRFFTNRTFALAFDTEKPKYGSRAVFNLYKGKITQPKVQYNGRIQHKFGISYFCLQFANGLPGSYLRWEACQNVNTQLFTFHQVGYLRKTPIGLNITKHEKNF